MKGSVLGNGLRVNEIGFWLSLVYLQVKVIYLIYIKVRCCQCRRLPATLESRDQVRLHCMHYVWQWKGPTDKASYINSTAQMGLVVGVKFFWGHGHLQLIQFHSPSINTTFILRFSFKVTLSSLVSVFWSQWIIKYNLVTGLQRIISKLLKAFNAF